MVKNKRLVFSILLIALLITTIFFASCNKDEIKLKSERVYSKVFTTVDEKAVPVVLKQTPKWQEGMIGGNGKTGFITSGSPYQDTIIYQNIDFLMPTKRGRDDIADVSSELETVRQNILNKTEFETSSTEWNYSYKYHPGPQIRLSMQQDEYSEYKRWTDYQTAEVGVTYTDSYGEWERSTFTSREDNVTITKISQSSEGEKINMEISIDDASKMLEFGKGDNPNEKDMIYKELVDDKAETLTFVAHYPNYALSSYVNGGYASVTYVINVGGKKYKNVYEISEKDEDKYNVAKEKSQSIIIEDAKQVYLITALDRTQQMGSFEDFADQEEYELVNKLKEQCKNVANKYSTRKGFKKVFDYKKALIPSAQKHSEYFSAVEINFGDTNDEDKYLSNEELLKVQQESSKLSSAMLERVYKQGRFAMICNGGYTMSRLSGMWTGEWDAGWRSIYTMDANVNLQSSGMNTSNMQFFGDGYIQFVYKQLNDWKTNAKKCYGFDDAILCPVNTDGDRALCGEYYIGYPFQYWNAGASWMIQPIYEYYQCYGDTILTIDGKEYSLLEDILYELLYYNSNFWNQLLAPKYYTDEFGNAKYDANKTELQDNEKFLIIPSYSPENSTGGDTYNSTLAVNSAMDISAAKYALQMAIEIDKKMLDIKENKEQISSRIEQNTYLLSKLPNYTFDSTGAIKEWCANGYEENNDHRHISHLYLAWPAFETQENEELKTAAEIALRNRNKATSKAQGTQAHGWLHKALVAARLKDANIVQDSLFELLTDTLQYTSFMTDHNTDRKSKTYCTDSCYGLIGIMNEMLMYSNTGEIEALPALPEEIEEGSVKGLKARTRAVVDIAWDKTKVTVTITSDVDQKIKVSALQADAEIVEFKKGETKTFEFLR